MDVNKISNRVHLPKWAQGILALVVVGGAIYVGYKVYKKIEADNEQKGSKQEDSDVKSELDKLNSDVKTKATLSDAQVSTFANSLFTSMDGYGNNLSGIYRVFANCKNDADVLNIIKAYGVRTLSSGKFNPEPNFTGSLGGAITLKLSTEQVNALNMMLAKSAIRYRF